MDRMFQRERHQLMGLTGDYVLHFPPVTVTAADRDRLVRGSYASAAEVAAMPDALVRRLLALMDDRSDVARDEAQEN